MAYAYLGRLYGDMGESALARESVSQAYQLRDRVSDRERFFITAAYDRQVTGNLEKARQTLQLWAQTYPRDPAPHGLLSGGVCLAFGRYEKGIEEGQKAIELDPDFPFGYSNLAANYTSLGHLQDARNVIQRASDRKLEIPVVVAERFNIAFLEGDRAGMERIIALSEGKPGAEDWITDKEAYALAYCGHLQQARTMSRRAEELAQETGQRETEAQYEAAEAVREALFGNVLEARRAAMAAVEISKGRDVEYGAAIALTLSGESSLSQALANDLEKRFPEDTLVRFTYMPTLRALLVLNDGKPSAALELLQAASPFELGSPVADSVGFAGALYPVYVRGEAYLAAGQGTEAATEFQKILDHRGIVVSDPIGALAHVELGRAYVVAGNKARAKSAYQDFLSLWNDADPDIPIFQQARTEYASSQ
jgi:predicted Zn-dependent protease